jgi:hypothetical protein
MFMYYEFREDDLEIAPGCSSQTMDFWYGKAHAESGRVGAAVAHGVLHAEFDFARRIVVSAVRKSPFSAIRGFYDWEHYFDEVTSLADYERALTNAWQSGG